MRLLPLVFALALPLTIQPIWAEDAAPAAGSTTVPATVPAPAVVAPKPFFGVRIDPNSIAMNEGKGLPLAEIEPNSTAANLGMEPGDPLTVEFSRGSSTQTASGTFQERPRPPQPGNILDLTHKVDEIAKKAEQHSKEPSLAEILETLQSIQRDMPKAVAAFKQQYPDGEFDIDVHIRIVSDKKAKDPVRLGNVPGALPGASAGSVTAGSLTAGSASPVSTTP